MSRISQPIHLLLVPGLLLLAVTCAHADIEGGARHIAHPAWMSPGLIDLETDSETVRADGKTGIMVLYTTQGCSYCAAFIDRSLNDPAIQARVREHFVSVGLEIFDDAEMTDPTGNDLSIKQFGEQHGAGMAPTLLFFGPDGDLMLRAVGYQSPDRFSRILDYLIDGHHADLSLREFLARDPGAAATAADITSALRDDPMFEQPPYALARHQYPASQPLLVLFETANCAPCDVFHDRVLALDEVRALLSQFEVVRLDASDDRTQLIAPDGRMTTAAAWFAAAGFSRVPALLYADEHGKVVFQTDAPVERQRMLNATGLVLERGYEKGWSYQRFARNRAIERNRAATGAN